MSDGSGEPQEAPSTPGRSGPGLIERVQARIAAVDRRVRALPPVRGLLSIMDTYNAAGGGLTAGGLAYSALFAVIPGILLVLSVLVIIVDDPGTRQQVIDWLVAQVPPVQDVAVAVVSGLADSARVGSVLGLVLFIWGASGFYMGLESAMERLFPGPRSRDAIRSRVRGVIAVLVVVGTVLTAFLLSSAASVLWAVFGTSLDPFLPVFSPLVAVVVSTLVAFTVYRLVPSDAPGWRAALPPSVLAGVAIGLLTSLFGLLAPLLVGGFIGLGVIASAFVALVWFDWVFQILLYGAAYARLRRDQQVGVTSSG